MELELSQLQNLIKRDPMSYVDEYTRQLRHYETQLKLFQLFPNQDGRNFGDLVSFLSHVFHLNLLMRVQGFP